VHVGALKMNRTPRPSMLVVYTSLKPGASAAVTVNCIMVVAEVLYGVPLRKEQTIEELVGAEMLSTLPGGALLETTIVPAASTLL